MTNKISNGNFEEKTDISELKQLLANSIFNESNILINRIETDSILFMMRDSKFLHKLKKFILALPEVSANEKNNFHHKLLSDKKFQKRLGDFFVSTIDRIDNLEKPEIFALLFSAFVKTEISFSQLRKIVSAVNAASIEDLKRFMDSPEESSSDNLVLAGLTKPDNGNPTEIGTLLIQIMKT